MLNFRVKKYTDDCRCIYFIFATMNGNSTQKPVSRTFSRTSVWPEPQVVCPLRGACVYTPRYMGNLSSKRMRLLQPFFHRPWTTFRFHFSKNNRGHSISLGLCPTKLPMTWDTRVVATPACLFRRSGFQLLKKLLPSVAFTPSISMLHCLKISLRFSDFDDIRVAFFT